MECGPDKRRVLAFLLKIKVRPGLDQRFDVRQLLAFLQHVVEEDVRNLVQWMSSNYCSPELRGSEVFPARCPFGLDLENEVR